MAMSSWNHSMSAFNELAIIVSLVTSTYLHFSWSCSPQNIPKWMIQWPRFCGPNSAPIDCEWLRFLSNSEVYKFVSWLFGFQGIQRRQPPSITIYHCISLENNHSVPQVFLWKKLIPVSQWHAPGTTRTLREAWWHGKKLGNSATTFWYLELQALALASFFFCVFLGDGVTQCLGV